MLIDDGTGKAIFSNFIEYIHSPHWPSGKVRTASSAKGHLKCH